MQHALSLGYNAPEFASQVDEWINSVTTASDGYNWNSNTADFKPWWPTG